MISFNVVYLSYDNYAQAITISNLCTDFINPGFSPSRVSVIALYSPYVKTICSLFDGADVARITVT